MSHDIEIVDGVAKMAYVGEVPWHGLGVQVPDNLSPQEMLEVAGLNWEVEKVPAYADLGDKKVYVGKSALVRTSDQSVLDVVGDDWNPVQNEEAFAFFNDFISAGGMKMHTAGSLRGGQIVWALAKVNDGFDIFDGDTIESYILFSNFHRYGSSTDVRSSAIRTVCRNTLMLSLNTPSKKMARVSHRVRFNAEEVKMMMGISSEKLRQYKEMALFLGSKRYSNDNVVDFMRQVLPGANKSEMSRLARMSYNTLNSQPGAQFAEGTWWQAFNAVTHTIDHLAARTNDNRLTSAWYGYGNNAKTQALQTALKMAA